MGTPAASDPPPHPRGVDPRWRRLGSAVLLAGVLAVAVAPLLPAWRTVYPDGTQLKSGAQVGWVAVPVALVAAAVATVSLTRTGPARRPWREASLGLLIANALTCGGLTGAVWIAQAHDAYAREAGMLSTDPGAGTWLALLGCLLIPLAGTLPTAPRPDTR
ncbi:hypothetical protein [Micromonospora sp. NPDC093244]|uniref:hypothetical protein n=1 Tax=Micromonospora sp. NPDC093244 TaxID=3155071 RepID=UPI003414DDD3